MEYPQYKKVLFVRISLKMQIMPLSLPMVLPKEMMVFFIFYM